MKNILVIADTHCGHLCGLTPRKYDPTVKADGVKREAYKARRKCWKWYKNIVSNIKPDILIFNGDAIDGQGTKTHGREHITTDISEQLDMAEAIVAEAGASLVYMTYGTGYHTGDDVDWEKELANRLNAVIDGHLFLDIEGVVLDVKHHIGSSQVPHGRATAVMRDKLWSDLWTIRQNRRKCDILMRSHAHYFTAVVSSDGVMMVTPSLQLPGSIFGIRRCSGIVDFGLIHITIDNGEYTWAPHLLYIVGSEHKLIKV